VTVDRVAAVECRGIRGFFVPSAMYRATDREARLVPGLRVEVETLQKRLDIETELRAIETASTATWKREAALWRRGYEEEREAKREAFQASSGVPWKTLAAVGLGVVAAIGIAYALKPAQP
jgi:hypothetical protein